MSVLGNIYDPHSGVNRHFLRGLEKLSAREFEAACHYFAMAEDESNNGSFTFKYMSYHGMTRCQLGEVEGLSQCRRAAHFEKYDGDVFHNLAISELKFNHRRLAVEAISTGLRIDPENRKLENLRIRIGERREPIIRFLSRDNVLNRFLGRLTWRMGAARRNARILRERRARLVSTT